MAVLSDPAMWAALLTLTALEIVLGIDNLIFLSITADRLPVHQQAFARRLGLSLALIMRLGLLASIAWIAGLVAPVFEVFGKAFSWRDLILIGGGLFLLYKGTIEIHEQIEGKHEDASAAAVVRTTFTSAILSIVVLDIVFSLDSVITAVGMVDNFWVMATAIVIAVLVMLVANGPVSAFINKHPTVKMLALSFLILIGMVLVADGFGMHVPKGFVYAAIGFSILVEALNMAARRKPKGKS
ncbi:MULTISPECIES: TerC family protein [unclassified Beijerinckia]|uniref:TerC family protein n=1 Tax=unclassified Beijerinckia TaxID=2638183 RepID=UPI0008973E0A|nr:MULTISPECIES: TerC family protein [unclassified Beijerinckia]MDH7799387.1 putative tellurium resistance membrane protein TerC [Beijerinckia sp. GAS462]SED48627.1 Membrane protein TerC, possibly involved in tellurium resistance [Beijerinckia sp. 28-YEA-48]